MKKTLSLILCFIVVFTISGCTNKLTKVPEPMEYPDYTFSETPTTDQLRQTAVRAMSDAMSIQWFTDQEYSYYKTGLASNKNFVHQPGYIYGGMMYSEASSGIFQFLEFYNYKTGFLEYDGDSYALKTTLGSACSDTLLWAWSTVCTSITGGYHPVLMVPANGFRIVGDYKLKDNIKSFHQYPSYTVIEEHPQEVILDAYAKTLPADALVSYTEDHAIMVIEKPVVVYLPDGSIDMKNSYFITQDNRAGDRTDSGFVEVDKENYTLYMSGVIGGKFTFEEMYTRKYIPVTAPEFIGEKAYEKAVVSASAETIKSFDELLEVTVSSNYPLALINAFIVEQDGKEILLDRTLFGGSNPTGVPRNFTLRDMENLSRLDKDKVAGCKLKFEVVVSTGERFVPIEFAF